MFLFNEINGLKEEHYFNEISPTDTIEVLLVCVFLIWRTRLVHFRNKFSTTFDFERFFVNLSVDHVCLMMLTISFYSFISIDTRREHLKICR